MVGGIGQIGKFNVTIVGHQKGRDTKENIKEILECLIQKDTEKH